MHHLSVIVPAFRPTDFQALRISMASNADVDAEWIVVDDGSGPDHASAFSQLDHTQARILQLPENCRQATARNAGLAQAKGKLIKFLDADDQLDQGHLAALVTAAQASPADAIPFAPTKHVMANGSSWVNNSWRDLQPTAEAQLARLLYAPFLHHCGTLFSRSLLMQLGGYDETLITDEDGDLLIRVLLSGAYFLPVPEVNYHYIHHNSAERVSADAGPAKLAARLRVCTKVEEAFATRPMPPAVRHGLARRLEKIALSYWDQDRPAARAALARARRLSPGYQPLGPWPIQLLRRLGGPSAQRAAASLWRRLRGRPAGGAQG
jgi:glycosyltransferase involved in cell wall biosynthesis